MLSAAATPRCTIGMTVMRRLMDGINSIMATTKDMKLPTVTDSNTEGKVAR